MEFCVRGRGGPNANLSSNGGFSCAGNRSGAGGAFAGFRTPGDLRWRRQPKLPFQPQTKPRIQGSPGGQARRRGPCGRKSGSGPAWPGNHPPGGPNWRKGRGNLSGSREMSSKYPDRMAVGAVFGKAQRPPTRKNTQDQYAEPGFEHAFVRAPRRKTKRWMGGREQRRPAVNQ